MLAKGKVEWLEGQNEALTKKAQKQQLKLQQSTEKIQLLLQDLEEVQKN